MTTNTNTLQRLRGAVNVDRLLYTAVQLVEIPSPTRSASAVANRLAEILAQDGFPVERLEAGWPEAPAVATRLTAEKRGRTLQFNGHLYTVHLRPATKGAHTLHEEVPIAELERVALVYALTAVGFCSAN